MESENNGISPETLATIKKEYVLKPKRSLRFRIAKWTGISFLTLLVLLVLIIPTLLYALFYVDEHGGYITRAFELPDLNQKVGAPFAYTSTLTARDGTPLACFTKEHRVHVEVAKLRTANPQVINAILASEDSRFNPKEEEEFHWRVINKFIRPGYDLWGVFHAATTDLAKLKVVAGGSTIDQQVVKVVVLTPERTFTRKFKEIFLAVKLKQYLSHDEILGMYLDLIYVGGPYGVGASSTAFFGSNVEEISLDQAAIIAGMINNSRSLVDATGLDEAKRVQALAYIKSRRDRVLNLMLDKGFIDKNSEQDMRRYQAAIAAPIKLRRFTGACERTQPFVSEYVRGVYESKLGNLHTGGYRMVTGINPVVQKVAEDACKTTLAEYVKRHPENRSTITCANLVAEIDTGEIVAMVGGQDFKVREVNGVTYDKALPGSAFKPFTFAAYLEHLLDKEKEKTAKRTATLLEAGSIPQPVQFQYDLLTGCKVSDFHSVLVPAIIGSTRDRVMTRKLINNYPEERRASYMGNIPCTIALASSQNSGTVWAEGQLVSQSIPEAERWRRGTDIVIEMAQRSGIASPMRQPVRLRSGEMSFIQSPTVPLGFNQVSLLELAEAYLPFFNGGCRGHLSIMHAITNQKGEIIEGGAAKTDCDRVLDPNVARGVRKMLQEVVDNDFGTAHSLRAKKLFPEGDLAGKTGTATKSDGVRVETNLFIGATPRYLIATRVSNIDRAALGKRETGARNALPVFRDILLAAHLFDPKGRFPDIPDLPPGEEFVHPVYDYEALHPEIIAQKKKMEAIDERRRQKKLGGKPVLRLDPPPRVDANLSKQKTRKH